MDVREKLVELLNKVQDTGVVEIQAGFGVTHSWVKNELVASHLIAHGVTVQEWIPVAERLPQGADGKSLCENVIAYLNNGEVESQVCTGWLNGDKWYLLVADEDYHTAWGLGAVTHWQPMPQPPKGE